MQINVVGTHLVTLPPDIAEVSLEAGFESAQKTEALASATELANRLGPDLQRLAALESAPVVTFSVGAITTTSWRPWSETGEVLPLRHRASAPVRATFRDVGALAAFIDRWAGEDGISVSGVSWRLTDEHQSDVDREAVAAAVVHARSRAETVAAAAGASGLRFVEVADPGLLSGPAQPEPMAYAMSRHAKDSGGEGVDLRPADVEVTATVHARFETTA